MLLCVLCPDAEEVEQVSPEQADMQTLKLRSLVEGPDASLVCVCVCVCVCTFMCVQCMCLYEPPLN